MSEIKKPFGVQIGVQSTKKTKLFFTKNETSVDIKEELKTISKFTTNINNISCSSDQEEELKNHIENEVLTNIENKINEKIESFAQKLVANIKNKQRHETDGPAPYELKRGNTEIGDSGEKFATEQGWNLGHTTKNRMIRVDDERMSEIKRTSDPIDLSSINPLDDKKSSIHEKGIHQNGRKLEENISLIEYCNGLFEGKSKKITNETNKNSSPKKTNSTAKKKSAKKSAKKKTSKTTKKKVSKNGRKTK